MYQVVIISDIKNDHGAKLIKIYFLKNHVITYLFINMNWY